MAQYPTPSWAKDINKTKQFHDWVNGLHPGTIKMDANTRRLGLFGPQTQAAWDKYGETYNRISKANTLKTTPAANTTNVTSPSLTMDNIPFKFRAGLKQTLALSGEKNSPYTATAKPNFGTAPNSKKPTTFDSKRAGEIAESVVPFVSNITNAFRKAPGPKAPNLISPISMRKPTNAVELRSIDSALEGINRGTDVALDSQTAAAVKAGSFATALGAKGASYERTRNAGIAIDNQVAGVNANINMANMQKLDQYGDAKVNAQIANAREGSENISNAADKTVQIGARKDAMELDRQRFDILSRSFSNSGVTDRLVRSILKKQPGESISEDEYNQVLGTQVKRFGGLIKMKKLGKHEQTTPPEMQGQYANGGKLTGKKSFGTPSKDINTGEYLNARLGTNNGVITPLPTAQPDCPPNCPKRKPIQVTNPNDPRLRAYNDSLKLSTNDINVPFGEDIQSMRMPGNTRTIMNREQKRDYQNTDISTLVDGDFDRKAYSLSKKSKISPISYTASSSYADGWGLGFNFNFKKPVQPVVYQKPQQAPIKKGQPTYEDSMNLYNKSIKGLELYRQGIIGDTEEEIGNYFQSPDYPKSGLVKGMKPISASANTIASHAPFPIFKKPVGTPQPQEPKFKPVVNPRLQGPDLSTGTATPNAPNLTQAKWDNTKPTRFSFTYPTGAYNEHKTMYFPEEGSWRDFIKGQRGVSSQQGKDYGTATGYLANGGRIGGSIMHTPKLTRTRQLKKLY